MAAAYLERIDLSAHGFYATPDITGFGGDRPFNYLCYGKGSLGPAATAGLERRNRLVRRRKLILAALRLLLCRPTGTYDCERDGA